MQGEAVVTSSTIIVSCQDGKPLLPGAYELAVVVGGQRGPAIPFTIAGLMFPNVRRWLALRRYQAELNRIVSRADDEVWRMEMAYVTGEGLSTRRRHAAEEDPEGALIEERLRAAASGTADAARKKLKEGDR